MRIGPFNISWGYKQLESQNAWKQDLGKYISCLSGGYAAANMIKLFESIPEVFAPIDTIAGAVCAAEWQLRRIKDDEVVYDNKVWNQLYNKPNWKQDWKKLVYNAIVYKYVTGNRYIYAYVPETLTVKMANVVNLWLLPPQYTTTRIKPNRPNYLQATGASDLVEYYDFQAGRDRLKIAPENILHDAFVDINPAVYENGIAADFLEGVSPLIACHYPMSNLMAVYEARNVIYVKRGSLGFLVSKKGDASGLMALTKTEKEELLKDYHNTYGLKHGKSPIAITSLPVDFIRTGLSIQELEPFTETDASSDAIYAALRVPRELKPRSEGATYENQKQAKRGLFTNVAIPEAMQLAVLFSTILKLNDEGYYLYPSFDHVEDLQENKKEKSDVDWRNNETNRVRFQHGIITLDDWIVASGLEATNIPLYTKRIFEMTPEEQAMVKAIISVKGGGNSSGNANDGNNAQDQNQNN
ncbi:phage portal protein [Candidatus Dependentiae bacterium]|nr:phage portal protein [Candidatus Dependentiae bacterium]